ncbi:hypothetical protein [uncultured Tateyamaria sp.]|uniref:hypothetical protein n=1 Tax=uncultured Tateyamaria sp. TaxID=455651 RepID=UPI00262D67F7|nr:hypothetical protein [uncultured Tateyamaria sp.]
MKAFISLCAAFILAGCADTVNQSSGTITDRGRTYDTVTRTFQRSDGSTYSRTTIYVGAERVTCRAGDRRDCQTALIDTYNRDRD